MPTVIDELIVRLGLDATQYKQGMKETTDSWDKSRVNIEKNTKDLVAGNKSLLEGFQKLKTEVLGFLAVLAGGSAITDFAHKLNDAQVALNLWSTAAGESPQILEAWGNAVYLLGGKAETAQASFKKFSQVMYEWSKHGAEPPKAMLEAMGKTSHILDPNKDTLSNLKELSASIKELYDTNRKNEAFNLGTSAGFDVGSVRLMEKYGANVTQILGSMEKLYGTTQEQLEQAEKLDESWGELLLTANSIGATIKGWVSEDIKQFFEDLKKSAASFGEDLKPISEVLESFREAAGWLNKITGAGQKVTPEEKSQQLKNRSGIVDSAIGIWDKTLGSLIAEDIKELKDIFGGGTATATPSNGNIGVSKTPNGPDGTQSRPIYVKPIGETKGGSFWEYVKSELGISDAAIRPDADQGPGGGGGGSGGGGGGGGGSGGGGGGGGGLRGRANLAKRLGTYSGSQGQTGAGGIGPWWTPERMKYATDRLQKEAGLSEIGAAGLVARWAGIEAGSGPTAYNHYGKGHYGIGQWDPDRGGSQDFADHTSYEDQVTHAIKELNSTETRAAKQLQEAKTKSDAAIGGSMFERAGGWNSGAGTDAFTGRTPVDTVLKAIRGVGKPDAASPGGASTPAGSTSSPAIFGDSIADGLKNYAQTQDKGVQGSTRERMGSKWVTDEINNFAADLKNRQVILSGGASNSRDPDALSGELLALKKKLVDMKNVTVLGVGEGYHAGDLAGFNEKLKAIAEHEGAKFQPLGKLKDGVHPDSYKRLWNDIAGGKKAAAPVSIDDQLKKAWGGSQFDRSKVGPTSMMQGVPLSLMQGVHHVTTSSSSNAMHIGAVNVNAPRATDADMIAADMSDALRRYQFVMMAQSGQV